MEYTLAEYKMVRGYTESLKECYAALFELKGSEEYRQLAESEMDHALLQFMLLAAHEIEFMDSLQKEILQYIRNT